MKWIKVNIMLLLCVLPRFGYGQIVLSQDAKKFDFYDSIKFYDLSVLWCTDSITNLDNLDDTASVDPYKFPFPEPLGYIGNNYQRFYVHFLSVKKNKKNPYRYDITGKTRVKDNVCFFKGSIIIDSADYVIDTAFPADPAKYKRGHVDCSCSFKEDKACKFAGIITGVMESDWCIYQHKIFYDNFMGVADGYSNNQFTGKWKSYARSVVKKCNWGDYRIPESNKLDAGAGEFYVSEKYLQNGWQNYENAYHLYDDTIKQQKALAEENREWWK